MSSSFITSQYLSKYEKALVIGRRAAAINQGAKVMIPLKPGEHDAEMIARRELAEGKLPMATVRILGENKTEEIPISSLIDHRFVKM